MSTSPFPPRPVVSESVIFNRARPTVSLLVEGADDKHFWQIYADERCLVHGSGGRPMVLAELDRGATMPEARLLAVLDADFDRLEGRLAARADVIWTDAHDLEATLLGLPALEKLLRGLVGAQRIASSEARWGESLRTRLFRHAEILGRLRWLKTRMQPDLNALQFQKDGKRGKDIKRLQYGGCVDVDWQPSVANTLKTLLDFSNAQALRTRALEAECMGLGPADLTQLCNGHDLMGLLAVGGEAVFRVKKSAENWTELLIASVERLWLMATQMWQALRAWEAAHPGFRVLGPDGETSAG